MKSVNSFLEMRSRMVLEQIARRGVSDVRVLEAMGKVAREALLLLRLSPFVALAAAVLCAGSANAQTGDAAAGRRLAGSVCSNCHVVQEGQRSAMDGIPTFAGMANDPAMTNERLRRFLNRPHSQMPPIEISRGEIDDLIAYIRTYRRR